jgi:serine/threonine protein kinase/Tfp pilus assembly protein PilF
MADTWRADGSLETMEVNVVGEAPSPERLAEEAIKRWKAGEAADAQELLRRHPQLRRRKSLVLDLALEEFCQLQAAGQEPDLDAFARRFPTYCASLRHLLVCHSYAESHPSLGDDDEAGFPALGTEFLGFPLLEELGRGAFARVYLAVEPRLGNRRVALKVSPRGMQEAERLAKLRHANIVPIYRVEQDPQTQLTAVCMPYLGRATLCDVLDLAFAQPELPGAARLILDAVRPGDSAAGLKFDEPDPFLQRGTYIDGVLHLARQLAAALHSTHQAGIYHLDLKPSNVLLTPGGRPMLLDFNLSLERDVAATRIGGTLPYMSPEQVRASLMGDLHVQVDHRSDVFSLGVILYELLTDCSPFGSLPWKLMPHQAGEHLLELQECGPRPLSRNGQVDGALARLIERCLSFDAAARPQTAGDLADQLHAQLGPLPRSRRWAHRHRKLVYTGVLLAAGIGGAATGYAYSRDPYWVRMYREGLAHAERAEHDKAIESFTSSLDANPNQYDVLIARARAQKLNQEYMLALADYRDAARLNPSTRLTIKKAYCSSRVGAYDTAIALYETAIKEGIENAALLTNLACCYMNRATLDMATKAMDLDKARRVVDRAIDQDDNYGRAFHCRAYIELRGQTAKASPHERLGDVERAIRLGPESGQLYETAARFCVIIGATEPAYMSRAIEYLEQAWERGADMRSAAREFAVLSSHARFRELVARPRQAPNLYPTDWFSDPVPEQ